MSTAVPVWFDALHVGDVLIGNDDPPGYAYSDAWLATGGAFPLSVTMPLKSGTYPADVVGPWLANLLPEEQQLSILTRTLGLNQADTLAVLKEIGGDTAGALSFGAPSIREAWSYIPLTDFYPLDDPQAALERHFEDLRARPFLVGEEGVRLSLAGGQQKSALAVLDADGAPVLRLPQDGDVLAIPRDGAPSTVIVKPDNPILPGIVENEAYCLHLAGAIGVMSAETTILTANGRKAICVLRYDRRVGRGGVIQRIHQEDFAQANGVPPGRKYERGTLPGLTPATLLQTGRFLPAADGLALLDQVIFNILVANTDAHAKNYSLLHPVAGAARLAPLYDVQTVLPWPRVIQYLAQTIDGKKRKPGDLAARQWDAIAASVGFRPADVRRRVTTLVDAMIGQRVAVTEAVTALPGCTAGYAEEAARLIEENALRILGRLKH